MSSIWHRWFKHAFLASRRQPRKQLGWRGSPPRVEALEDRYLLSTFTVVNTNDSGAGSLREAINQVNADPSQGIDRIKFSIGSGVQTIALQSALPSITHSVVIDGTTQPGFRNAPLIVLNGSNPNVTGNGSDIWR